VQKRSAPPTKSNGSHLDLGLVNVPVSHAFAWKSVQSDIGKRQEQQDRQTRLVDGREAVRLGTKAQRLHIIRRFEEEIGKTPQRKKLYQEAIDRAMDDGVELKTSSTDVEENKLSSVKDGVIKVDPHNREGSVDAIEASSASQAIEENDDVVFAREIELAMQLSLDSAYV
jgi:sterol 3beta-glucosyltransferase